MGTIPFSNPGGNNQTNPVSKLLPQGGTGLNQGGVVGGPQGTVAGAVNPYAPPTTTSSTGSISVGAQTGTTSPTSSGQGFITSGQDDGQNALQKQLNDIYGQGVGGSLFQLLNSMSGTDSTILQEYIQSLQPQMAKAQSDTNATLGAGGVSANSSVAAIADSNLQSQEFASIASESASLTQNQEQLTAQILSGMEPAAAKEVATSNWTIFGDVMSDITGDIGHLMGGSVNTAPNTQQQNTSGTISSGTSSNSISSPIPQTTGDETLYQLGESDTGENVGAALLAFE